MRQRNEVFFLRHTKSKSRQGYYPDRQQWCSYTLGATIAVCQLINLLFKEYGAMRRLKKHNSHLPSISISPSSLDNQFQAFL